MRKKIHYSGGKLLTEKSKKYEERANKYQKEAHAEHEELQNQARKNAKRRLGVDII